jgi:transcriptional regulator with XRE-family HTH domain
VNIRNEAYNKAFGANLKRLRTAKKLSREALAAQAGIEPKQVYRIEVGESSPTIATVVTIATAMGMHPKKMFDFDFDFKAGGLQ